MLLEFRCANYKSFREEMVFSMVPTPKQKGLDYSLLEETIGRKKYHAVCSAVIYGPNAAGKTNIIGAMDAFRAIVLRGHIRNVDEKVNNLNFAASALELIPNSSYQESMPVQFGIKFTSQGLLIDYSLVLDVGVFLEEDYDRKILAEKLIINNNLVFNRSDELQIGNIEAFGNLLVNAFDKNAAYSIAEANLDDEELFLTSGFKTMFSAKLVSIISNWLRQNFMVAYSCNRLHFMPSPSYFELKPKDIDEGAAYIDSVINEAADCFGLNSFALGFAVDKDSSKTKMLSLIQTEQGRVAVPAELYESYGTMRFVDLFPLLVTAILNGSTLVMDEFDASIHPMAIMNVINIFHNDEINRNHAQLIFNTHNPIFLNSNLFRRDEIKFVERDDETHGSVHYSLADFGTSGENGVRRDEDYLKNYFVSRYGAIRDVDFTPIFESVLNKANKE